MSGGGAVGGTVCVEVDGPCDVGKEGVGVCLDGILSE